MKMKRVDVAVIGAGTAGLNARRAAEREGAEAILIESGPFGTTCARVGCMPSKLLIAAADVAHEVEGAGRFGIEVATPPRIRGKAVLERVRRERDRFVSFVIESTESVPEALRLRGHARFLSPTMLEVGGEMRVEARAIVIAAGSTPIIPPALAPFAKDLLTNESIFELEDLPESIGIVGTGVIALELGQALHRLGVRTVIYGRSDRLGPLTDPAVQREAREVLGRELTLRLGVELGVGRRSGQGFRIGWRERDGKRGEDEVASLLVAAGRRPNLDSLSLDKAGVRMGAEGVPQFDPRTMQCGETPIFLAGDASNDRPVLHEAAEEGRIAGRNAARFPDVRAHRRATPLAIVFTHPQIALVGARHADLGTDDVEIGEVTYEDQGRARVMGQNAGRVRIYARRACGTLIGAEMLGPRVEHTAHLVAWAVEQRMTVREALASPIYHPVIEEGIQTALRDLAARLKQMPPEVAGDLECGPGN